MVAPAYRVQTRNLPACYSITQSFSGAKGTIVDTTSYRSALSASRHLSLVLTTLLPNLSVTANKHLGCPTVAYRNPLEISLANFTVLAGSNHLQRSVANGTVESGALQRGSVKQTNLTVNTENWTWNTTRGGIFDQMHIKY